jgi:hypothetical protein
MENLIISILYAVVFINIFLSFLIFIRGARRLFNIFFGLLSFSVALWSFAIIGFYTESLQSLEEFARSLFEEVESKGHAGFGDGDSVKSGVTNTTTLKDETPMKKSGDAGG